MLKNFIYKFKKNTEIFGLIILIFITAIYTSYFNFTKNKSYEAYNNFIDNKNILFIFSVFLTFGIVWFINAFNFMDGINGITSVQVISICLSLLVLDYYINNEINILAFSVLIIILVFCYFNWTPASIFLGDAGSIPLGFIVFVLLYDRKLILNLINKNLRK